MPSLVKLHNGDTIRTDEDPQALAARFDASRRDGTLIKLQGATGVAWINPHALALIEQAGE